MTNKWYEIRADVNGKVNIYLYGEIGWDVTTEQFIEELGGYGQNIDVDMYIGSGGGSVWQGTDMYNAIASVKGHVNAYITSIAASMASYIPMAADKIYMYENAIMVIHRPHGPSYGTADAHKASAAQQEMAEVNMINGYAKKSGKNTEEIKAIMDAGQDNDGTWLTAEQAVGMGFADEVLTDIDVDMPMAASISGKVLSRCPDELKDKLSSSLKKFEKTRSPIGDKEPAGSGLTKPKEENLMVAKVKEAAAELVDIEAVKKQAVADALKAEGKRQSDIKAVFTGHDAHDKLLGECSSNMSCSVDDAKTKLLSAIGKGAKPVTSVEVVEDERDKFVEAATDALMLRAGVAGKGVKANEFRGFSMSEMAAKCLLMKGVSTSGMNKMQIVGAAFTQSTSDFPVLLENIMHKTLMAAYTVAPDTWTKFCRIGSVSDFRTHNRFRVGSIGNLDELTELNEFTNKAIPDGEKATISVGTKGNTINISRQTIVNDDLGALTDFFTGLGRAAKRTIESDVYTFLAANAAIDDGVTLFHSTHGNLAASGAVISVTSLDAARVAMASQQDITGNEFLDITPNVLLCGVAKGGLARVTVNAQYDPDTANKLQKPNMVNGIVSEIVDTARISGNEWYLFSAPNVNPVLEVAFLDGNQDPYLELENGFTVDGARYKVRHDFGIAATDYRGGYKNPGA